MNDSVLQSVANELIALSKESDIDESGYKRIMIPQPYERNRALEHINKYYYQKQKSFHFTDSQVINEVRRLYATGKSVWIILDTPACIFNIYTFSNDDRKTDIDQNITSKSSNTKSSSAVVSVFSGIGFIISIVLGFRGCSSHFNNVSHRNPTGISDAFGNLFSMIIGSLSLFVLIIVGGTAISYGIGVLFSKYIFNTTRDS